VKWNKAEGDYSLKRMLLNIMLVSYLVSRKIKAIICTIGWVQMANNNNYVIQTENLTLRFGGLAAVNSVPMKVKEGDIMGLIGPNGAGKKP
jgi:ABC-type uncharacterized transport system ATPase subunit